MDHSYWWVFLLSIVNRFLKNRLSPEVDQNEEYCNPAVVKLSAMALINYIVW